MNCCSNGYIGYVVIWGICYMIINIWCVCVLLELIVKVLKIRISGILIYLVFFFVIDILRRILMKKKSIRNVNFLVCFKVIFIGIK